MRNVFLTASFVFIIASSFAQTSDSLTFYFDGTWEACDSSEAMYYRKAIWGPDKKLAVRDYYKAENTIQMTGFFKDKSGQIKTDTFIYFYRNGSVSSSGRFEMNKKEGEWISYREEGSIEHFLTYKKGEVVKAKSLNRYGVELTTKDTFDFVDKMPEFQGGEEAMRQFLRSNLNYPSIARENGIQGRVVVEFILNKEGRISNIEILKSPDKDLENESVRVIRLMPDWTPGKQDGVPVAVRFTLPVVFKLN